MAISQEDGNWALNYGGQNGLVKQVEGRPLQFQGNVADENGSSWRDITQGDIDSLRSSFQQGTQKQQSWFDSQPDYHRLTPEQIQQYKAAGKNGGSLIQQWQRENGWGATADPGYTNSVGDWASRMPGADNSSGSWRWRGPDGSGELQDITPEMAQQWAQGNDIANRGNRAASTTYDRLGLYGDGAGNIWAGPHGTNGEGDASDFDEFMQAATFDTVASGLMIGGGSALTSALEAGGIGGSTGSSTLVGDAASDTLPGETLYPGEANPGPATTPSTFTPGDTSQLYPGEANPGPATTPESGSLLDFLSKGPGSTQGYMGLQPSDLLKTGMNLGIQQLLAQRQAGQAQQVQRAGNPLNDPQRAPFQQQATNMVNNPNDYFANNPFASSLAAYFKNNVIPSQVAKSGNPGEVLDRTGSQFATALGGNYNQLLQTLMTGGGFNQGNTGVGASVPLLQGSNNAFNESFRGLGGLASKSIDSIFGDPTRPNSNNSGSAFGSTGIAP